MSSRTSTAKSINTPQDAVPHHRRNHAIGVFAGAIGGVGISFIHPELVIAGMIYSVTESPTLVATVTILSKLGALGPQLLASSYFEHHPRKMPSFFRVMLLRGLIIVGLLASMWGLTIAVNAWTLTAFFAAFLLLWAFSGAGHVLFMDMVGRMINRSDVGVFFARRHILGNALAIAAGLVIIQPVLDLLPTPQNYLLLAIIGGALITFDMYLWTRARETEGPRAKNRTTFRESLKRGKEWLRADHNYRCYLGMRVAFRLNYLGLAFFIPYGVSQLPYRGPGTLAMLGGIMVATMQVSRLIASALWGRVADSWGFRSCMVGGSLLFLLSAGLALLSPHLPEAFALAVPYTKYVFNLPIVMYFLALLMLGVGLQGLIIGQQKFLVTSAPEHRRGSYIGFMNTITCPLTLLPLVGAAMVKWVGMESIFWLVVFGSAMSTFYAARMQPTAVQVDVDGDAIEPGHDTPDDPGHSEPVTTRHSQHRSV